MPEGFDTMGNRLVNEKTEEVSTFISSVKAEQ
jgi:hypothetical protein